jgi:hypothetical protein
VGDKWTFDHPQEDLPKVGYRWSQMKVAPSGKKFITEKTVQAGGLNIDKIQFAFNSPN